MIRSARTPLLVAFLLSLFGHAPPSPGQAPERPNVVLIVCDDLNDWVGPLGGHPQARTPNIDAFARTAVTFDHAYTNTPVCAPSRASFLTGILPQTSGNLFWKKWHTNDILANSKTIMRHFRDNGYKAVGVGKLMHHQLKAEWDEMPYDADYGPVAYDGTNKTAHPNIARPFFDIGPIDGSFARLDDIPYQGTKNAGWVFGRWQSGPPKPFRFRTPDDRDETPDERAASWAIDRLQRFAAEDPNQPFFMGIGFIRPHTPMHAPGEFFALFPLEGVRLPMVLLDDERDTHYDDHYTDDVKGLRYHRTIAASYASREDGLRRFTQAYLACTAFVDHEIGRVLDALDASPFARNTIVIITSDHGFNMGEKSFLFKNAPWEESARIPLFIRDPRLASAGGVATNPVSLIDLYPTLVDLCALKGDTRKNDKGRPLDGHSLRPLLEDPNRATWTGPDYALTMLHAQEDAAHPFATKDEDNPARQHWSIRTQRYRYIRYNDGSTELYDHDADPNEWHNLADDPEHTEAQRLLHAKLRTAVGIE